MPENKRTPSVPDVVKRIQEAAELAPDLEARSRVSSTVSGFDASELSDKRTIEIAFQIIELLHGVPVGQAMHVLDEAKSLLIDSIVFDTGSCRFIQKKAAFEEFFRDSELSHLGLRK